MVEATRERAIRVFVEYFFSYNEEKKSYSFRGTTGSVEGPFMEDIIRYISDNGKQPSLTDLAAMG